MDNYIIIHGSFGSKDGNWFPWLKNELEKDNKDVVIPQMPVGVGNQNFENWSKVLNELKINENTIIIAHSIAPIFVCKYLIINNDPYVKFEVEKSFADSISNEQYVIKNGGHINAESGYTKFEEILKVL